MKSVNLPYSPRIDQLRWFAATLVFLFHFSNQWRSLGGGGFSSPWMGLVTEGHTGVALFFTLSGFLFMRIAQFQGQILYRPFVRNRMLRILPLYLIMFLIAVSLNRDTFQPQDILYLFSANLGNSPTSHSAVTGAVWCIPLEFLFYLLFPWLSRFAMEQGMRYLLQLLAMMVFFKLMVYSESSHSTLMYFSTFVGRFDQFLMGMLAAMFCQRHQALFQRWAGALLIPAAVLVVCACAVQASYAPFNAVPKVAFWITWSVMESFCWAIVIILWTSWQGVLPGFMERTLTQGGKISFSFYLLHTGFIRMVAQKIGMPVLTGISWLDAALALLVIYAGVWGIATLSYHTIEEPFLRLRSTYGVK